MQKRFQQFRQSIVALPDWIWCVFFVLSVINIFSVYALYFYVQYSSDAYQGLFGFVADIVVTLPEAAAKEAAKGIRTIAEIRTQSVHWMGWMITSVVASSVTLGFILALLAFAGKKKPTAPDTPEITTA